MLSALIESYFKSVHTIGTVILFNMVKKFLGI